MKVQTSSVRKWMAIAKGPEWTKRQRVSVVRTHSERVAQHDLVQLGNSVFWRGAEIRPRFSNKQKDRVDDVRKTISV